MHSVSSEASVACQTKYTDAVGTDEDDVNIAIHAAESSDYDILNGMPLGPTGPPQGPSVDGDTFSTPQSPYSANRAAIRNLTLPAIPNFDIPPSPPGSPSPGMNKKFEHFLELKKQGIHFNDKLAKSSALKNPSLLQKLMDFAGIDEEDQYNTTLPEDIWNPKGFPAWAYKEELAKSQQDITKRREEERSRLQRESIEFVLATNSTELARNGTPANSGNNKGLSAAERVMAGLDRDRIKSPHLSSGNTRKDSERRVSRFDDTRSATGPRSPKRRKRSRSR